ncbi:MAG: hypothetical protein LN413_00135 [Candidatus Thermoplasmatota archaeon]|nr:hypothetical protein [Candidatus Thermoplasmatota archaeon]
MTERHLSDDEIRDLLEEIDADEDLDVTTWEADFLENVLHKQGGPLSPRQRESALQMVERYGA